MRPTPNQKSTVTSMKSELNAAGGGLADNADVLRSVLAGCGDCIKILDLDGRLQFMSEGGKRVMEVEDFGALKGCPWPDFWAGAGNANARLAIETARTGGTARFQGAANTVKALPATGTFKSRRSWEATAGRPICYRSPGTSPRNGGPFQN